MQRRAPYWFTHGKTRQRIADWWPWALGGFLAVLYARIAADPEKLSVEDAGAMLRDVLKLDPSYLRS